MDKSTDPPPVQGVRSEEPQGPVGQDEPNPDVVSDATADETSAEEQRDPGTGGYAGRDPKTEMPRVPSEPETQDDPGSHDAAPSTDHEPPASN
jgi:hypothetical protein